MFSIDVSEPLEKYENALLQLCPFHAEHDNGSTVLFFIGCLLWFCCPFRMYEEYVKATEAKLEEFSM